MLLSCSLWSSHVGKNLNPFQLFIGHSILVGRPAFILFQLERQTLLLLRVNADVNAPPVAWMILLLDSVKVSSKGTCANTTAALIFNPQILQN